MADLQDGWLVFESARGKRRLEAPYPVMWQNCDLRALEALCEKATPVRRQSRSPSGQRRAISAAEIEDDAGIESAAIRTFVSPGGREWTVRIHECFDKEGEAQKVLRYTAGDVVVELHEWPEHWQELSVLEFAMLLLDAEPPRRRKAQGPQRRREDRVA